MRSVFGRAAAGYNRGLWPVLSLLLLAILIPTVCLLWFMNEAIVSQRRTLAEQRAGAYRTEVSLVGERVERYWEQRMAALEERAREKRGAALFAECVRAGLADSLLCFGEKNTLEYPAPPLAPGNDPALDRADWGRAVALEDASAGAAAEAYAAIARSATETGLRARALQAEARCLVRAGRRDAAVELVLRSDYGRATDLQGRLIAADAGLMALQFIRDPKDRRLPPLVRRLASLALDYEGAPLPAGQRLFLMRQMRGLAQFPTFDAEELAARYLEAEPAAAADASLRRTALEGVWKTRTASGKALALLRTGTILARTAEFLSDRRVTLSPPGAEAPRGYAAALGTRLPGWRATLVPAGAGKDEPPQRAFYLWIGLLVIAAMSIAGLLAARLVQRQMQLARLKADLVASVSHELKTPVASVSVLVDNLLDAPEFDPARTREYLELIARENARLSRLIENFLTFSRMERGKYSLELAGVDPAEVVAAAVEAAGDRFQAPECALDVTIEAGLPLLRADREALATALLNLLDNAYKYSPGEKRIALRAYALDGSVRFEVADRGIGVAPRDFRRIFRKFYQVDQRLSRTAGGCGLGLSIVDFIVKAHGGSVDLDSKLGEGSVFTIRVPVSGR